MCLLCEPHRITARRHWAKDRFLEGEFGCIQYSIYWSVLSALNPYEAHWSLPVDCVWNVMTRAQKPDLVFQRNGRVHLNRQGRNAGYTMFRDSVKSTGYPLHSPVSLSFPLPCVTVCHRISTGLYHPFNIQKFYVLPTQCINVFCVDFRTNSDYFPIQH
jgi:hypothetical protein